MTRAEFEKVLTGKYGYGSYYDAGVLMFTGNQTVEKMRKDIQEKAKAFEYGGSWGIKGYSKDSKHKPEPKPAKPAVEEVEETEEAEEISTDFSGEAEGELSGEENERKPENAASDKSVDAPEKEKFSSEKEDYDTEGFSESSIIGPGDFEQMSFDSLFN